VNTNRALTAAKFALTMQINEAVDAARVQINDIPVPFTKQSNEEAFVMPLPTLF
jgi:hypothetical protein